AEPQSKLEAKCRTDRREETHAIQRQIEVAAIYATPDQEEALAISDRICVMNAGRVEQIGTPQEIYGDPQTLFVARFVGTLNTLSPGPALDALLKKLKLPQSGVQTWTVRPAQLELFETGAASADAAALSGQVSNYTYLGREAHVQ